MIGRNGIAARIPHAGHMILLDAVLEWSATRITCRTATHRDPGNPLAQSGTLDMLCGIEYAGQAMALHGALCGPPDAPPRQGFLASVREVVIAEPRLDMVENLLVTAEQLHAETDHVLYAFTLTGDGRTVLSGRAAVVLA